MADYRNLKDEELVSLAQNNDVAAVNEILDRYKNLVRKIARPYFFLGGDAEDLIQEGSFAIFRAVQTFNGKSSFLSYVYICIKNGIISLVKKSAFINGFSSEIPFSTYGDDNVEAEIAATVDADPEQSVIRSESEREFKDKMKCGLSGLEYKILSLYLDGYSYDEIGKSINKSTKSVDNALQRIKNKTRQIYGG